jgi:hypothetical protein
MRNGVGFECELAMIEYIEASRWWRLQWAMRRRRARLGWLFGALARAAG